jgi:hypothetical protein
MKQGQASRSGKEGWKVEPKPHAVHPGYAGQLGMQLGNHSTEGSSSLPASKIVEQMHAGRGYSAPKDSGVTVHKGGSQRRHT